MSCPQRHGVIGRRLWSVALTRAVLAVAAAGPSAALATTQGKHHRANAQPAQATPDKVIDAEANPSAAADALNSGCADTSQCTWHNDTDFTND